MDLLPVLCILIEILSRTHAQGEKSLNEFKFGTFIVRFPSDGPACSAVKGIKNYVHRLTPHWATSNLVFYAQSTNTARGLKNAHPIIKL